MKRIAPFLFSLVSIMAASAPAQVKAPSESVVDRFVRYGKIDTHSLEDQKTVPSTRKQLDLANLLADELRRLDVKTVRVSPFGIVYAMLPGDPSQVIEVARNPVLKEMIGDDIITSDGTTLLGSDDKAGVAAIMTLVDTLRQNPQIPRGPLAPAFTPDEEVGGGIDKFDSHELHE
jgi:tripeptide aminopeptidase